MIQNNQKIQVIIGIDYFHDGYYDVDGIIDTFMVDLDVSKEEFIHLCIKDDCSQIYLEHVEKIIDQNIIIPNNPELFGIKDDTFLDKLKSKLNDEHINASAIVPMDIKIENYKLLTLSPTYFYNIYKNKFNLILKMIEEIIVYFIYQCVIINLNIMMDYRCD